MSLLAWLLVAKIVVTFFLVSAPFLVLPKARIDSLSGFGGAPTVLFRLYGVAILALLIGYAGGLFQVLRGEMPWGVICMGIVSNAGAAGVLALMGEATKKSALTAFFGLIAVALVAAAAAPQIALAPL